MRPFLDWLSSPGFNITRGWNTVDGWIGPGKAEPFDTQRRILGHCFTLGENGKFPYTTIVYSTVKKSGKSMWEAAIGSYYAEEAPAGSEIFVCANDMEQASSLVFANMKYDAEQKGYKTFKEEIRYPNGTTARVLAKEYKSAAGRQSDLTLWDELWAFDSDRGVRMWSEMTLIPTSRYPMRVIVTYAGYENADPNLLLDLYKHIVMKGKPAPGLEDIVDRRGVPVCWVSQDNRSFAYWDTEPRLPWQTQDYYEQEAALLPPLQFLRLHRNMWVSNEDQFIPVEWFDAAVERGAQTGLTAPLTMAQESPLRNMPISLAVDVGVKQDCSAVVGVYYDLKRARVGLACCSVWNPKKMGEIDLEATVEAYIHDVYKKLKVISIVYDPSNFHRSMTTLKNMRYPMLEVPQSGDPMIKASKALYDSLRNGTFESYPEPELREHLKYAIGKATPRGFRIAKEKNSKYPNDAAVALAMAVHDAIERGGMDTSKPIRIVSPFTDHTRDMGPYQRPRQKDDESWLPEALRSRVY